MLIIIFLVGLVILGLGMFLYLKCGYKLYNQDKEFIYWILNTIGGIVVGCTVIAYFAMFISWSFSKTIDDRIDLYQTQNSIIEEKVITMVNQYQEYEQSIITHHDETFDSYVTLANLYPDLKANTLFQEQIQLHIDNNRILLKLKEEKLNYKIQEFWLFLN